MYIRTYVRTYIPHDLYILLSLPYELYILSIVYALYIPYELCMLYMLYILYRTAPYRSSVKNPDSNGKQKIYNRQ